MTRAPILFRCDATASQGYESFYQCLTYAAAMQRRRRGSYFLSRLQPNTLLSAVQKGGNEWRPADHPVGCPDDLAQTLATVGDLQAGAVAEASPERLEVVTEPADISLRLSRCHFALTSGDGWALELACIGIPQLLLVQSPGHMMNAQRLDDEGAAVNLGDCDSVTAVQLRQ